MEQITCQDCVHFRQHYYLTQSHGFQVDCGHCICPRIKHRKATAKICQWFQKRTESEQPDREKTIRFLTTELLAWIMEMELPPVIEKADR